MKLLPTITAVFFAAVKSGSAGLTERTLLSDTVKEFVRSQFEVRAPLSQSESGALSWGLKNSTKGATMFLKEKKETSILGLLAGALGVLLISGAGTLAAGRSATPVPGAMPIPPNPATASACQAVLDGSAKLFTTPYHMYMTETGAGVGNEKPVSSETIFAGGALYVQFNGKWSSSLVSAEDMKAMDERNRKNVKNMSCHYVRDDSVNGESAAIYSTHEETAHGMTDTQIWVSKSKGLELRQEIDLNTGGKNKTHIISRFEYSNIHAPRL
ncbi:MAG TPA: hypothetical protein VG028_17920 [Terriglobia bacterium]|nr:hypothetical protein [Terriglobia bacterium]